MAEDYYDDAGQTAPQPPRFVMVPLNSAARKAIEHVRNKYWQYQFENNTFGLWIDFSDPEKQVYSLGRGEGCDIYLPDRDRRYQISEYHASFEVVEQTGAVLLFDRSSHRTTEPMSVNNTFTVKYRKDANSVLVAQGINTRIAFGRDRYYQFELQWHSDGMYHFPDKEEPYAMGPKNSRAKKYVQADKIGGGAYGNVYRCLDATTGTIMAVKKFHNMTGKNLDFATREIANLFRINKSSSIHHDHILQVLDYAGGGKDDNWGEIFMPLMEGNLKTLVEKADGIDDWGVSNIVLRQMLLALDCIASHKIVHRDIKPENILWQYDSNNDYHFCLGDFGLSNDPLKARTVAGTEPFMAPEVYHRQAQTTKVDIWSLFSTVVWVRNTSNFRNLCGKYGAKDIHSWLVSISKGPGYENIRGMASVNPKKRPSAAQQLAILDSAGEEYNEAGGGGEDLEDDLGSHFNRAMNLGEESEPVNDSGYAQGGDEMTSPEMPYYEPYVSGLMESYPWEPEGGPSKKYAPGPPRDPEAWVAQYENAYAPPEEGGGSGGGSGGQTEVPEMWTARPLVTEEEPAHRESRRKQKGKYKH
ncbi:kinase-like domain-containing protein [Apodospora peruviana]|uniref:non-specific serine/threonine protein kinase n=1 Tax=Apodospora peruviana TaxID=516989 RepID=A0AAE0HSV7_9PEZI|nr:kinase-like domain-containing protein [Apodospora peruviana]